MPVGFEKSEDWGFLGKNDFMSSNNLEMPSGFATLFNSLVKDLSRELGRFENSEKMVKKTDVKKRGIGISIYTSGNMPPKIKISPLGDNPDFKKTTRKKVSVKLKNFEQNPEKFAGLPKKEPETNIRRLSNKIIYEIHLPDVKSIKDVSIIQLENSIEIKALGGGSVFYKVVPVNLPIKKYNLSKEKLVLEFDAE